MEVRAVGKFLRVPPRKARLIADQVRGLPAADALTHLKFMPQKAAAIVHKLLTSAVANAENNHRLSRETLKIATIFVDEGPRLKRIQPRAMGRAYRILKRTSHITVVLDDSLVPRQPRPRQTPKPKRELSTAPAAAPAAAATTVVETPAETVQTTDEVVTTTNAVETTDTTVQEGAVTQTAETNTETNNELTTPEASTEPTAETAEGENNNEEKS